MTLHTPPAFDALLAAAPPQVSTEQACAVAAQPLVDKGFTGQGLGEAIKRERLRALKAYKDSAKA